jgi:hypothetical protein
MELEGIHSMTNSGPGTWSKIIDQGSKSEWGLKAIVFAGAWLAIPIFMGYSVHFSEVVILFVLSIAVIYANLIFDSILKS